MIYLKNVKRFCKEFEKIENYQEAISSPEMWDCHHRLEETGLSKKNLIDKDMYYNRPASELIFLTRGDHRSLHNKGENNYMYGRHYTNPMYGKHHTIEAKNKMSKNHADFAGDKNPAYKHICPALLQIMYIKQGKCIKQIAKELGHGHRTIVRHLKELNIPIRKR